MKHYDNTDLKELLDRFKDHLKVWKVGLSLGSFLYFELGDELQDKLQDGTAIEVGSTTLVLEADEWTISWRGKQIADSDSITKDMVDNLIWKYFEGKRLISIEYVQESKECRIQFSEEGITSGQISVDLRGESDEDICTITFPDGTIIVCNAQDGFVSDETLSDVHLAAYSAGNSAPNEPKLHRAQINMSSQGNLTVETLVVTYPESLLRISRNLIDEGQFSLAVVVAHTACEIGTERLLSQAFAAQGLQILERWVRGSINSYSLANDRVRSLYRTLTGDNVQQQVFFWQKFKASSNLRNKIIHSGTMATKADAEASYEAANELLAHLRKQANELHEAA